MKVSDMQRITLPRRAAEAALASLQDSATSKGHAMGGIRGRRDGIRCAGCGAHAYIEVTPGRVWRFTVEGESHADLGDLKAPCRRASDRPSPMMTANEWSGR